MASLMDVFTNTNAQNAANAQSGGIASGAAQAGGTLNAGLNSATGYYNQALNGYAPLASTANAGYNQYANAMGLNGASGNAAALTGFQNNPGYQFQVNQGINAVDRGAASRGALSSGGTVAQEQSTASNIANQGWNSYLSNLGQYNQLAPQIAGATSTINQNLGNLNYTNAQNNAGLQYGAATGEANAQANADLANNTASSNMWGALMGVGNLGAKVAGLGVAGPTNGGTIGGNWLNSFMQPKAA